jgi:hypothetical protein
MFIFFTWILLSLVAGFIGSDRKIGFWMAFMVSLLLSPLIGIIIAAVSKVQYEEEYEETILQTQVQQQKTLEKISEQTSNNLNFSVPDEILKLKELQKQGILTEEEFETQKKKLLDK